MAATLARRRALVLYGPTRAWIDPVRYLANASTGRLGARIVESLARRGATVEAIIGPGAAEPAVELPLHRVESVDDVLRESERLLAQGRFDAVLMAMAILDYVPAAPQSHKRAADAEAWHLELRPTPKVLDRLRAWAPEAILVGFKLESDPARLLEHARELMARSGAELVVANLTAETSDADHRVTILHRDGAAVRSGRGKAVVAEAVVHEVERLLAARSVTL